MCMYSDCVVVYSHDQLLQHVSQILYFLTPLPVASALSPTPELVELLLQHGAVVKEKNKLGWTPLDEAVSYGDRQTGKWLSVSLCLLHVHVYMCICTCDLWALGIGERGREEDGNNRCAENMYILCACVRECTGVHVCTCICIVAVNGHTEGMHTCTCTCTCTYTTIIS